MRFMKSILASCLLLGMSLTLLAADKEADDKQTKEDLTAFKEFLKKTHDGKKWQSGPLRIDSDEIRKAYPKQRFYFVHSSPPLPPGAPIALEAYQKRMEEFRRDFISVTARIDDAGKITPQQKPDDYNTGLMKVASDDDAKLAAAAIMALYAGDRVGPGVVALNQVKVTKTDKGWTCVVSKQNLFHGNVIFDAAGKCTAVSKQYAGPLPP